MGRSTSVHSVTVRADDKGGSRGTGLPPQKIASCRQDAAPPQVRQPAETQFLTVFGLVCRYGILALVLALGLARLSSAQVHSLLILYFFAFFKLDAADILYILQTAAVTFLVWLLLGGLHTLYLVYATGWRDFQIVIR